MAKLDSRIIKTGTLNRSFTLDRTVVNEEKRTIELSFSSEFEVKRWFGNEILDHSPESCDLARINTGGALLVDHNPGDQIGVIESARIDADRKGRAVVRFGKSKRAEEIFQDVKDGIRSLVSVGYQINKMITERVEKGVETLRAVSWTPLEISIVSIPADTSVGVGREIEQTVNTEILPMKRNLLLDPAVAETATGGANIEQVRNEAATKAEGVERSRVREITAIANKINNDEVRKYASKAIDEGIPLSDFQREVIEKHYNAKPINTSAEIGMNERELKDYSITRAIVLSAEGKLDGLEKEASDAVAKLTKRESSGFFIPQDVAKRTAMNATTATLGGFTVGTDLLSGSMIELLRNKTLVNTLGVRTLSGLVGNIAIPKVTGGATAYWLSEDASATNSQQAFGQLGLTPHRLVGLTAYNRQLLVQSSIDVESFVRDDLMRVLALEKDRAFINGSGVSGEPLGILNTTGIGAIAYGAATTWAKIVENETTLATANADLGSLSFLTTPATRGKWKTNVKVSGQAIFLWEGDSVNGYPAHATNQVPSDKTIFANWNDGIMAEWVGMDVISDPLSRKKTGEIEVQITLMTDNGLRHPLSFVVSTDSGAQ